MASASGLQKYDIIFKKQTIRAKHRRNYPSDGSVPCKRIGKQPVPSFPKPFPRKHSASLYFKNFLNNRILRYGAYRNGISIHRGERTTARRLLNSSNENRP